MSRRTPNTMLVVVKGFDGDPEKQLHIPVNSMSETKGCVKTIAKLSPISKFWLQNYQGSDRLIKVDPATGDISDPLAALYTAP